MHTCRVYVLPRATRLHQDVVCVSSCYHSLDHAGVQTLLICSLPLIAIVKPVSIKG